MSDGNAHNNYNVRVVVGRDRRSRGIATSVIARVRLANLSLSLMAKFGVPAESFGNSTNELDLCRACSRSARPREVILGAEHAPTTVSGTGRAALDGGRSGGQAFTSLV